MILIIKHIAIEGPGTLGDFLKERQENFRIVELGAGDQLPKDPQAFKALIVLGGPMNVDEEDIYPFLKPENDFIGQALKDGVPYLGICLGAQLLAKAAGAKVVKSPVKEVGWYHIALTAEGKTDPLFKDFRAQDPVYQWHGDMFEIPVGGQLLATAQGCPHQALKVGDNAYGLQFHVEITEQSIKEWCAAYSRTDLPGQSELARSMIEDHGKYNTVFDQQAQNIYQNFLGIINAKNSARAN